MVVGAMIIEEEMKKMSNNLIEILRSEVCGKKNATEALKELEGRIEVFL